MGHVYYRVGPAIKVPDNIDLSLMPDTLRRRFWFVVNALSSRLPDRRMYVTKFISDTNSVSLHHPEFKRAVDVAHSNDDMELPHVQRAYIETQALMRTWLPYGNDTAGRRIESMVFRTPPEGKGSDPRHERHAHVQGPAEELDGVIG